MGIRQTRDGVDLSRLGESHYLPALNAVVLGAGRSLLEDGYYPVSCVWTRSCELRPQRESSVTERESSVTTWLALHDRDSRSNKLVNFCASLGLQALMA